MSRSNPQIAIDSLPLTKSFQLGNVVSNKLVPDGFSKSQNFYLKTWREQSCQNSSWGETWNYVLPESLNVVSSHFLEIDLNLLAAGTYKKYPGLYAINRIKLLSNGSEVYDLDYKLYMREFLSSLSDEESLAFVNTYMGGSSASNAARTISCPMMLPNSHYLRRHSGYGYGIFPHKLSTRLEFQITMGTCNDIKLTGADDAASIQNACRWVTREVKGDQNSIIRKYSDARGVYSVQVPRFQEIVPWKVAAANTADSVKATLPTGCCYEFLVEAYPTSVDLDLTDRESATQPTFFKITCDGEDVRVLANGTRVGQELFANGYRTNSVVNNFARICFADQCSKSDHCFQGAIHCGNISSIQTEITFTAETRYRIVAKKYSKVRIQSNGILRSSFE